MTTMRWRVMHVMRCRTAQAQAFPSHFLTRAGALPSRFPQVKYINRGAYAEVLLARNKQNQQLYALKFIERGQEMVSGPPALPPARSDRAVAPAVVAPLIIAALRDICRPRPTMLSARRVCTAACVLRCRRCVRRVAAAGGAGCDAHVSSALTRPAHPASSHLRRSSTT